MNGKKEDTTKINGKTFAGLREDLYCGLTDWDRKAIVTLCQRAIGDIRFADMTQEESDLRLGRIIRKVGGLEDET